MEISLDELVAKFGGELRGDGSVRVQRISALDTAGAGDISFLSGARFRRYLPTTRATAVILDAEAAEQCPVAALVTPNPYLMYARVASLLHPPVRPASGIHPSAVLGRDCRLGRDVCIGPHVCLGDGVRLGDGVVLGAGCVLGNDVEIGDESRLAANVTLYEGVVLGRRVVIHSGAVLGADGFGFANDRGTWVKIPQIGRVVIEDDVEIGANTTIDRGALEDTVIGRGVKLDNQVQIAHNVRIGEHTAIAGCTGIAGSATIGRRCAIGGGVGISGHLEIADDVHLTGTTFVSQSIREKGVYSSGTPFEPVGEWRRNFVRMRQLDDMAKRLQRLEQAVRAIGEDSEQGQGK
ncbi:MAG: UDP-3-O-(3-hydroxymyristoyl)glucosamine N-acyltransferase [Gammaproteobacteria bacterium]|jgi:UDP-3-O-[3-hydroxymyristoyl] glucosamine N-acyltransferase|nr:UDP-3-O-(3-hydroxymyristoyl)glucosamine N-acyltransferase [Gammaproteobacteria bacterium]